MLLKNKSFNKINGKSLTQVFFVENDNPIR